MPTAIERVAIVGQGYVGLPLAMAASGAGYAVTGIESDPVRLGALQSGQSPIEDVASEVIAKAAANGYSVSSAISDIAGCDALIFCLPTPLDSKSNPDLTILLGAISQAGPHLKPGALVIVESTIQPGTMRDEIYPLLAKSAGHDNFELAYSPERIDPNNPKWNITNTAKLVAGFNESAMLRAETFYKKFVSEVHAYSSIEVIETAKLLENAFRLVNISFINELAILCAKLGVDVMEVISAAATKPYGFMPFYPSAGVGGHCIPIDPMYLANKAREVGTPIRSIELAHEINEAMPNFYLARAVELLGNLSKKRILIVGLAYKSGVADVRESAAEKLLLLLRKAGAAVSWHDEIVGTWSGESSTPLSSEFDLVVLVNVDAKLDLAKLGSVPVLNTFGGRK